MAIEPASPIQQQSLIQSPYQSPYRDPLTFDIQPLTPYTNLQRQYYGPLSQQPQPAVPKIDDETMEQLRQRLLAVSDSSGVLNGSKSPDPASVLLKSSSKQRLSPGEIGKETLQGVFQETVGSYIDTWKRDWKTGLLETLGGAAVIGGAVALDALTGGLATPVLIGVGAALVLPGTVKAIADEVEDPTDANLVRMLVSTATGALTVGLPIKGLTGVASARRLLSGGLRARQDLVDPTGAADLILSGRPEMRQALRYHTDVSKQMEMLQSDPDALRAQFTRLGVKTDDGIEELLNRSQTMKSMQQQREAGIINNDVNLVSDLEREMERYAREDLAPARQRVAHDWLFLPSNPYSHIPLDLTAEERTLAAPMTRAIDQGARQIIGTLRAAGDGHGIQALHEPVASVQTLLEHQARDHAADSIRGGFGRIMSWEADMFKAARINRRGESDADAWERIYQALEEPDKWAELRPNEMYFARQIRAIDNVKTVAELRRGTIAVPLAGRVQRLFRGVTRPEGPAQQAFSDLMDGLRSPTVSWSRLWKAAIDVNGDVEYSQKPRSAILAGLREQEQAYRETAEHREFYREKGDVLRAARRTRGGLAGAVTRTRNLIEEAGPGDEKLAARLERAQANLEKHEQDFLAEHGQIGQQLLSADFRGLRQLIGRHPPQRTLVSGWDLRRAGTFSFLARMNRASFGDALMGHANLGLERLRPLLAPLNQNDWGLEIAHPEFAHRSELPDVLPETVFRRGLRSPEQTAVNAGYIRVHAGIGRPGDLNYRPSLYAREEIAKPLLQAQEAASANMMNQGALGALYKYGVSGPKRFIMASPAWHAMNVAGRAIAFLLNDPAVAGAALRQVGIRIPIGAKERHLSSIWGGGRQLLDTEQRAYLAEEFAQAGGFHANRWEVGDHLRRLWREQDAQPSWPGVIRNFEQPFGHVYGDMIEGGFWKAVDDLQLAGYQYAKHRLRGRLGESFDEGQLRVAAAEYANNLAGMVNPLYMSTVYKHMRNMIFFAPSYWATFMRSIESALPGSARLSQMLATKSGGQLVRFGAVPLRHIDYRVRKELVRMQRSWFLTYMATGMVSADLLNVMLGGRHLWENDEGRMFDINVSRAVPPSQTPSGEYRQSYVSAIPFFRQAADVANAMGLGHDWGLAHQFSDPEWERQDMAHKAMMAAGALADGVRRQGSTKLAGLPQAAYGATTGEDLSARLGQGVQKKIDRWEGLLSLVPGGYQLERSVNEQRNLARQYQPGTPQYAQAQAALAGQEAQAYGSQLLMQYTGIPSVYHMGAERSAIDDDKFASWQQQRNDIHEAMLANSKAVFSGIMPPIQYQRHKEDNLTRMAQLDRDTFGPNSPAGSLAGQRAKLAQQTGLDQPGLSDEQWYERYELYEVAWEQTLQQAGPEARAAWWDVSRSQWTDADYLEWEAKQMKQALMASVDGQGGNHIRAYQQQIGPLLAQDLTPAERKTLEEGDPYYYTYRTLLKNMARTSALGAFISAFSSPYSGTRILQPGLSEEDIALLEQAAPGSTFVRPETAARLVAQARQIAAEQAVRESGGQAVRSSAFDELTNQAIQNAIAEGH